MVELHSIATVSNNRNDLRDDNWGEVVSNITLNDELSGDLFIGLSEFSHVEVVYIFNQLDQDREIPETRHPRNNPSWPKIGVLAQRSVHHPNPIGLCSAEIVGVDGKTLIVKGLDAVNGSPVLDIKPVFREFQSVDQKLSITLCDVFYGQEHCDQSKGHAVLFNNVRFS